MSVPDFQPGERRRELADLLRTRRARITPDEVGLPRRARQRTPGLRREDVAELCGISVTWYTWLEQGRAIRVSTDVLEEVARVLRMSADERAHLFQLAGRPLPSTTAEPGVVPPAVRMLLAALEPFPAHVRDPRWRVLAWNGAEALIAPWDALPPEERHVIWNHFTNPDLRRMSVDWEGDARTLLALFRQAVAPHLGDPALTALIERLARVSPEFAAWWPAHEVQGRRDRPIRLRHPDVGTLSLERCTLVVVPGPPLVLRTLVARPEDETAARLAALLPVTARIG